MRARVYHHRERDITIEMAPRQSGKTARLIQEVIIWINRSDEHKAHIFAMNHREKDRIRNMLRMHALDAGLHEEAEEQVVVHNVNNFSRVGDVGRPYSWWNLNQNENVRMFFDEFEHEAFRHVPIMDRTYMTSSPTRRFEDSHTMRVLQALVGDDPDRPVIEFINSYLHINGDIDQEVPLRRVEAVANQRQLRGTWRIDVAEELQNLHGINVEDEVINAMAEELTNNIVEEATREAWQPPLEPLDVSDEMSEEDAYLDRLGI